MVNAMPYATRTACPNPKSIFQVGDTVEFQHRAKDTRAPDNRVRVLAKGRMSGTVTSLVHMVDWSTWSGGASLRTCA